MIKPKAGPVLGGLVGLLALVGLAVTLVSPGAGADSVEKQVDAYFAREREETPEVRYRDVPKRLEELQAIQGDPRFAEIPPTKQRLVNLRVRELNHFTDFVSDVDHIADPKDVANEEQLKRVKDQLVQVRMPSEYRPEWEQSDAGRRYLAMLEDARALDAAVDEVRKGYRAAIEEGEGVLRDRNAPRLPQRAKAVLDRAAQLPTPEKDKDRRLPGSERLTYSAVFRFPSVAEARAAWEKVRDRLKPLAVE